jgi:hypothetical protein
MLSSYVAPTSQQQHIDITRYHFDQLVTGRGALARILWLQGFPDQAMRMAQNNVENARARDQTSLCTALDLACMIVLEVADLATTERYVTMLLERSAKVVLGIYQAFGHSFEGELLIKRGDVAAGVQRLRAGLDELREASYVLRSPGLLGTLAEGLARIGQVAEGLMAIDDALAQCERTDERWNMTELLRVKGELLLLEGAPEAKVAAEHHYQLGLEWARRQGALFWELRCASSLARLLRDQSRSAMRRQSSSRSTTGLPKGSTRPISKRQKRFSTLSDSPDMGRCGHSRWIARSGHARPGDRSSTEENLHSKIGGQQLSKLYGRWSDPASAGTMV